MTRKRPRGAAKPRTNIPKIAICAVNVQSVLFLLLEQLLTDCKKLRFGDIAAQKAGLKLKNVGSVCKTKKRKIFIAFGQTSQKRVLGGYFFVILC